MRVSFGSGVRIKPRDKGASVLYRFMNSRPGMPLLGSTIVDPKGLDVVGRWIDDGAP